jgi:hypothetical protein
MESSGLTRLLILLLPLPLLLLLLLLLLQARALWLVGACGQELNGEQWVDAWGLAVAHMGAADLVVALQAVQAVLLLAIQILDDQAIIDQVRVLENMKTYIVQRQEVQHRRGRGMHAVGRTWEMT